MLKKSGFVGKTDPLFLYIFSGIYHFAGELRYKFQNKFTK